MVENIIQLIESHINVTPEMAEDVLSLLQEETPKRGDYLVKEGEVCRKMYFIEKGFLRVFYHDDSGKEVTHTFVEEMGLLTNPDSFFTASTTDYYIEAIEDCQLKTITLDGVNFLLKKYPTLEKFGRLMSTEIVLELTEMVKDLQFRTAQQRYELLLKRNPSIIQRAPLGHIASYLGITQQSLSRIRASMK